MFDTRDDRAGAQGTQLYPMHPEPDGLAFSQEDRQLAVGVYPNILGSAPVSVLGIDIWLLHEHHHGGKKI